MKNMNENDQGKFVMPGDLILNEERNLEGTYTENGKTYAAVISILKANQIIPLKGRYVPHFGDFVVGIVAEERFSGYTIDLNAPYNGNVSSRDLMEELKVGDVVLVKVANVDEVKNALLAEPRKLIGGEIIEVEPVKIPRIIGRNSSMVSMIKQYTKCEVTVGKNGRIHLKGGDTAKALNAITKICKESHTTGLTDRIKQYLESN